MDEKDSTQPKKSSVSPEFAHLPRRKDQYGKYVPEKPANKPYLSANTRLGEPPSASYQDFRAKKEKMEKEKRNRQTARAEMIARGEDPGPDPDAPAGSTPAASLLKTLIVALLAIAYAGYFVTGDFQWGYRTKWTTLKHWSSFLPDYNQKAYTESQLARYDGSDPSKPILLALDGIVYDVTSGKRTYGPGGSYHQFAGRDAARAFVTGCFETHLTHDIRGFDQKEVESLNHWKKFYADHEKYKKVGTVYHAPIDPASPIPPPCTDAAAQKPSGQSKQAAGAQGSHKKGSQ